MPPASPCPLGGVLWTQRLASDSFDVVQRSGEAWGLAEETRGGTRPRRAVRGVTAEGLWLLAAVGVEGDRGTLRKSRETARVMRWERVAQPHMLKESAARPMSQRRRIRCSPVALWCRVVASVSVPLTASARARPLSKALSGVHRAGSQREGMTRHATVEHRPGQATSPNPQISNLNPQTSNLNPQPSTLKPQPPTLNPQASNLNSIHTLPAALPPWPPTRGGWTPPSAPRRTS